MVQLFIDELMFFVDPITKKVYSAKLKPLKGQKLKAHDHLHYMIKYNGKKKYLSYAKILELLDEKLQSKAQ